MVIWLLFSNFADRIKTIEMKRIFLLLTIIAAASCCQEKQTLDIVPYPNEVNLKSGNIDIAGLSFNYSSDLDVASKAYIESFADQLSLATGKLSVVSEGKGADGFSFILDQALAKEAYTLSIGRKHIEARASSLNGFVYAIQTLKQMMPVEIFGKAEAADKDWSLPCCTINDAPRFSYRGMHMDVSRHFFDMDMVKKYLDIMEVHKLNTLHWHLTDDQGWRIEIKKYPKLTEVGSIRKETLIGHIFESDTYDGTPYGEGCYFTQDQIREIIAYAAAKGINIIPEIDLPGHMLAALAAYPELGCTGGPYDVWGRWGVADEVLCAGKEETMIFLENVLAEVADLFPYEYFHIGGDECPTVYWETCPHCQAKIKELGLKDDDKFQAEHYLQSYVMKRMTEFLGKKGKKVIGWDEILEGEVADDAIVMSWRGAAGGIQAARMGLDAVMTPNTHFYLDYYQTLDQDNEPLAIGGYIPIEKCYSYEPFIEGMTDEEKSHILGVQANLWTEYITTNEHLEYMLLPRLAALSEVQWCQPEVKNWDRFLESADDFCAIYETSGYNYAKHIFQITGTSAINKAKACVEAMLTIQGDAQIHYTLDGSEPDENSPVYTGPIEIRETCTLKAKSFRDGFVTKTYTKEFIGHKAMGRPVTIGTEPHSSYVYSAPDNLTDGILSMDTYTSGDWAGWYDGPFEATVDMNDCGAYESVTLSTYVFKHDWIFNPTDIKVLTSENGKDFTEVAYVEIETIDNIDDGNGRQEYTLTFTPSEARYLKVIANSVTEIPDWHTGKGSPGFLFVDEIIVK